MTISSTWRRNWRQQSTTSRRMGRGIELTLWPLVAFSPMTWSLPRIHRRSAMPQNPATRWMKTDWYLSENGQRFASRETRWSTGRCSRRGRSWQRRLSPRVAPNMDQSLMLIASPKNSMKTRRWTRKSKSSINRTLMTERQLKLIQIVQLWPMNLWEITWAPKLTGQLARLNLIRMIKLTNGKMARPRILLVKQWRMGTRCRSRNWPRCPQTSKTAYYLQIDPGLVKVTSRKVEIQNIKWQELVLWIQITRWNTSKKVEESDQDRMLPLDHLPPQQLLFGK